MNIKKSLLTGLITTAILGATNNLKAQNANTLADTLQTETAKDTAHKKLTTSAGYNAVETAITNHGDARIRTLINLNASYKDFELGISGLDEFTSNIKTYFGRNVVTAGLKDKQLKLAGVFKTTADGVIDAKYGIRYNIHDKLGIDYGRVDITANKHGGDAALFLGKVLPKGLSAELYEEVATDFKSSPTFYTELQLNKEIMKGFNVFLRGEMAGINYKGSTYLFGITKTLP